MEKEHRLKEIIRTASRRLEVLQAVAKLNLPDCWIGGGFIRNAVWDALYGKSEPAPINDIDVVYFKPLSAYETPESILLKKICLNKMNPVWEEEEAARLKLEQAIPDLVFEVKNQARMHLSNARTHEHPPYTSLAEALSDWVETVTSVAAQLTYDGDLAILAPQGLEDLFAGILRPTRADYEPRLRERAQQKGWLTRWPVHFEPSRL